MPNIPPALLPLLCRAARECGAEKLVLFGSRARGDHRPRSDIDLAVYGVDAVHAGRLRLVLEELPTLLSFDLVSVSAETSPALIRNIEKEGVLLYAAKM